MARTLREKQENLEHTHSKLGIFIEQALPNDLKQDWKNGTGKFKAAKSKYCQIHDEIWQPINTESKSLTVTTKEKLIEKTTLLRPGDNTSGMASKVVPELIPYLRLSDVFEILKDQYYKDHVTNPLKQNRRQQNRKE